MLKIWSELPNARLKEQLADVLTAGWVVVWGSLAWQLYLFLAGFATIGRTIRGGGESLVQAGRDLGDVLAQIPLIGEGARDIARNTFAAGGHPLSDVGSSLEAFILIVAAVLGLLLAGVTLVPWLNRYLPWRWARLRQLRAAHRVIRRAPKVGEGDVERTLALRAVTRLDYQSLLDFTPDPFGDWASGRHDRLAKAELASVGLRP